MSGNWFVRSSGHKIKTKQNITPVHFLWGGLKGGVFWGEVGVREFSYFRTKLYGFISFLFLFSSNITSYVSSFLSVWIFFPGHFLSFFEEKLQKHRIITNSCTGSSITKWQMYFADFSHFKSNITPFFDIFMHKTFAHFILHTFWCILMHIDAFWALGTKYPIFAWKIVNFTNLYVIKITSLIISCTKHLHISFCIHLDAFWCILMRSDHLEQNLLFLLEKSSFLPIFIK